jgi:hypothetical protein
MVLKNVSKSTFRAMYDHFGDKKVIKYKKNIETIHVGLQLTGKWLLHPPSSWVQTYSLRAGTEMALQE